MTLRNPEGKQPIHIYFRGAVDLAGDKELFLAQLRDFLSSFSEEGFGTCYVLSDNNTVKLHLVVHLPDGKFEASASAPRLNELVLALKKNSGPQLSRFKKGG